MRTIAEKDIKGLQRDKKVTAIGGKALVPYSKKPKPVTPEERQAKSLETISQVLALSLEKGDKDVLLEAVRKIQNLEIQMPENPKPVSKWKHTIVRDNDGKVKGIISEAILNGK